MGVPTAIPKQQISSPCQSEGLTVRERFLWDHAATLELAALALNPGFTANCTSADNRALVQFDLGLCLLAYSCALRVILWRSMNMTGFWFSGARLSAFCTKTNPRFW